MVILSGLQAAAAQSGILETSKSCRDFWTETAVRQLWLFAAVPMIQVEATCVNDSNNKLHAIGVSAMRNMQLARVSNMNDHGSAVYLGGWSGRGLTAGEMSIWINLSWSGQPSMSCFTVRAELVLTVFFKTFLRKPLDVSGSGELVVLFASLLLLAAALTQIDAGM
jgi:hypothetical protein